MRRLLCLVSVPKLEVCMGFSMLIQHQFLNSSTRKSLRTLQVQEIFSVATEFQFMSCQVRKFDKHYGVRLTGRDSFSPILVNQFGKKLKFHISTPFSSLPLVLLSSLLSSEIWRM